MQIRTLFSFGVIAILPVALYAGPTFDGTLPDGCQAATLTSYQASSGCAEGIVVFSNFSFAPFSSTGSPLDTADDIWVRPTRFGFAYSQVSGQPFQTGPNDEAEYQIGYDFVIDPGPIFDGADLFLDPPSGGVTVTQYYCNDSSFAQFNANSDFNGPLCQTPSESNVQFFQPETLVVTPEFPDTGFVPFGRPANNYGSVLTDILLNGTAQFDEVRGDANLASDTPEPMSAALLLGGLGLLALRRKIQSV